METKKNLVRRTYAQLEMEMSGKWYECISELAPALSGAIATFPQHTQCPMHASKGDGLRLFPDFVRTGGCVCNTCGIYRDGFAAIAWVNGWTRKDAVKEVAKWLDGDQANFLPVTPPKVFEIKEKDPAKAMEKMRDVLAETTSIRGTSGQLYLENRGIWANNLPETLRFHPGLEYWVKEKDKYKLFGVFPCIVAPLKDLKGRIVALHRIYITEKGEKAPVPGGMSKKLMTPPSKIGGAAIKLFPFGTMTSPAEFPADGSVLGVGEGVETVLAVRAITRMPVWASYSATLLEQLDIPAHVKLLVIWADLDKSNRGREAADALIARLAAQGRTDLQVEVYFPNVPPEGIPDGEKGVDWLDVLVREGINGFPEKWRLWTS